MNLQKLNLVELSYKEAQEIEGGFNFFKPFSEIIDVSRKIVASAISLYDIWTK